MPLTIYTGNRMENLVSALARVVQEPLAAPLAPEVIVVQSKGMQRWLAMELAARFGVWGNCEYPFPNAMVRRLFGHLLPHLPDSSPFDREVLAWKVMDRLPFMLARPEFAPLRHYLSDDREGLKLFQLAGKIADTFDQYTLFRPAMLLEWERGNGGGWQGILWRELAPAAGEHRGRLREQFLKLAAAGKPPETPFPERVSIFGISYLPNYHMEILAASARYTQVNLFLLSPTREYWGDLVSLRERGRRSGASLPGPDDGNPLLASLGTLGRDFSDTVIELGDAASVQEDLYHDPGGVCLLHRLQSDILHLRPTVAPAFAPDDRSLQIHSCHSPLREMEVLHDNLLRLFEEIPELEPRDVVVMTPDIEAYAPYITTVFHGCQDGSPRIPCSIADRSMSSEGAVTPLFLKLLSLPGSRLTVVQLLDILEAGPVAGRFELDEREVETVRSWLNDVRVRWGMDEGDRLRLGLPGYRDNSWQAGLDRLLLGYALPEEGGLFQGKLPYDEMEGGSPATLGKLVEFVDRVRRLVGLLDGRHTPRDWGDRLRGVLDGFFAPGEETARERTAIAEAIATLAGQAELAGFGREVGLPVVRSWLAARIDQADRSLGFMTGGVTFCAMLPMRSIPFRVVALVGMSDGAFPRQSRPPGFDLIARHPKRGDRSLREEDRYLFLEALLSARDCLYISYVGQSIRDNAEAPPSPLVSELLDVIGRGEADLLVTRHRLQPFSRDYFVAGSPLFSYSAANCAALRERCRGTGEKRPFLLSPLPPPPDEWREVPLERLLRFFAHPARFFLEQRLGLALEREDSRLEEREPFLLDGLESYRLKTELLDVVLQGGDPREYLPLARQRGNLPPGRHGETLFAGAVTAVTAFAGLVREHLAEDQLPPLDLRLHLGGYTVTGRLDRIMPRLLLRYRCAGLKGKDRVRAWIEHLVLNAVAAPGYPRETRLVMVGEQRNYAPVAGAAELLTSLLNLYWEGLSRPLPFFPVSSIEYAGRSEWRLERAVRSWQPGYLASGEGDDPAFRRCFGDNPFDADFDRVAREVLEPLLGHETGGAS